MQNPNYNLRGFSVEINGSADGIKHCHYFIFIDLVPPASGGYNFDSISWSIAQANDGSYYLKGSVPTTFSFPSVPAAGANVRTYFMKHFYAQNPAQLPSSSPTQLVTGGLRLKQGGNTITSGDPCRRKPPIVTLQTPSYSTYVGQGWGLSCSGSILTPPSNPALTTLHPVEDYFVVGWAVVPNGFSNILNLEFDQYNDPMILKGGLNSDVNQQNNDRRAAVGVYDAMMGPNGVKLNSPIQPYPTSFCVVGQEDPMPIINVLNQPAIPF